MTYLGELISIGVAFSWTATALLSEFGSKRLGNLTLNVFRMALALVFSLVLFGVVTGNPLPPAPPCRETGRSRASLFLSACHQTSARDA